MKTFLSPNIKALAFVTMITAMLLSTQVQAQETHRKIVTLKTSEKFTGAIIEAVPEQYIKLQMGDGTVKTIQADDILNIKDEPAIRHRKRRLQNADKIIGPSVIGSMFAGYDLMSGLSYLVMEPSVSAGIRIKRHHIGMGLGVIYASSQDAGNAAFGPYGVYGTNNMSMPKITYLPIGLNYHGDFGRRKVFFSADASVGYPINLTKEIVYYQYSTGSSIYTEYHNWTVSQIATFYAEISPGVSFKVSPELLLNVSLTFHLLMITESNDDKISGEYPPSPNHLGSNQRTIGSLGGALKIIF
jgi:hypothetical protein